MESKMYFKFHDDLNINSIYSDVVKMLEEYAAQKDEYRQQYERFKIISTKSNNP
jgi:hypothetical protein